MENNKERYRCFTRRPVFVRAVERLRELDITRFPEPRPVRGFCAAGTVNQGRAPWLTTLLPAGLSMEECCAAAQGLRSPYETASVVSPSIQAVVDCIAALGDSLPAKRRQAIKEFKKISKSLEGLSKEMRDSLPMPAYIKQVSGGLHCAMMAACVIALDWRDPWIAMDMIFGLPVLDCPDSGCHRLKEQPAVEGFSKESNIAWNKKARRKTERIGKRCAVENDARLQCLAVWSKTLEEEALGHVTKTSEKALNDNYGHGGWRCMNRFGVWQDGKWRCCDDAAASGHNLATYLRETIHCIDCDFPSAVAIAFARAGMPDCTFSTDDINGAYRKVGNAQPMYTVVIVWDPIQSKHVYFELPGFNFGLKSAVVGFNRVPELGVEVCRRIFVVACGHFFDDYACIDPRLGDGTAKEALWVVHDAFCFHLSVKKSVKSKYVNPFLGVVTDLSGLKRERRVTRLSVKPERATKLRAILVDVLDRMVLTSSQAARLRGKLYFLTTTSYGRVGRAPLQALVKRQYFDKGAKAVEVGSPLHKCLQFFLALLDFIRPRVVSADPDGRDALLVWTDAMFEAARDGADYVETWVDPEDGGEPQCFYLGKACVAYVVFDPVSREWIHGSEDVGLDIIRKFVPGKKTYIGQLESLAAAAVYFSIPREWLIGREVIHWVDNQSAMAGFVKGYSGKEDTALILSAFSFKMAELQFRVWWEFVPSAQNVADLPSRGKEDDEDGLLNALGSVLSKFIVPEFGEWNSQIGLIA